MHAVVVVNWHKRWRDFFVDGSFSICARLLSSEFHFVDVRVARAYCSSIAGFRPENVVRVGCIHPLSYIRR